MVFPKASIEVSLPNSFIYSTVLSLGPLRILSSMVSIVASACGVATSWGLNPSLKFYLWPSLSLFMYLKIASFARTLAILEEDPLNLSLCYFKQSYNLAGRCPSSSNLPAIIFITSSVTHIWSIIGIRTSEGS